MYKTATRRVTTDNHAPENRGAVTDIGGIVGSDIHAHGRVIGQEQGGVPTLQGANLMIAGTVKDQVTTVDTRVAAVDVTIPDSVSVPLPLQ